MTGIIGIQTSLCVSIGIGLRPGNFPRNSKKETILGTQLYFVLVGRAGDSDNLCSVQQQQWRARATGATFVCIGLFATEDLGYSAIWYVVNRVAEWLVARCALLIWRKLGPGLRHAACNFYS